MSDEPYRYKFKFEAGLTPAAIQGIQNAWQAIKDQNTASLVTARSFSAVDDDSAIVVTGFTQDMGDALYAAIDSMGITIRDLDIKAERQGGRQQGM